MAGSSLMAHRDALLLLVVAVLCGAAVHEGQSYKVTMTPVTVLSKFKPSNLEYLKTLKSLPIKTAFASYLTATRQPYLPNDKVKMANFQATLQRLVDNNAGDKLKHVYGINAFTQLNNTERARYLSLRRSGRTRAQGRADNAEFLSKTASISLAEKEAAAERMYAQAAANSAALRTVVAQDEDPRDWSKIYTSYRNSGRQCSSGWAFAAAAVAEGASFFKTRDPIVLSTKQLIDCDPGNRNGCDGGSLAPAFDYIVKNGLTTEYKLPYVAEKGTCPSSLEPASRLASFTALPPRNEAAMYEALLKGPIAVALTIDDGFMNYVGGIYASESCTGADKPLNHAAVIIGAGYDEDKDKDYWLLRLSWGEEFGEGGSMRLLRNVGGTGACNIAMAPYQVTSADKPRTPPPIAPGEDTGCTDSTVTVTAATSLADIAKQYKTTVAKIQIDNELTDDPTTPLTNNRQLSIKCPSGIWSEPYGIWRNRNAANAMVAVPTECICPEGQFVTQVEVTPSLFFTKGQWTGSTYVGGVSIVCTGADMPPFQCKIDAQPGIDKSRSGLEPGAVAQASGFATIFFRSSFAIDSMFSVGAQTGGEGSFPCPDNMALTGMAGGASPVDYLKDQESYISSLQFRCSNFFGLPSDNTAVQKIRSLLKAPFPKVSFGKSCRIANLTSYKDKDLTWQAIASRNNLLVNEVIRANPNVKLPITRSTPVFFPPCNYGLFPTRPKRSRQAFYKAISKDFSLAEASAAVSIVDASELVAAEADASADR